MRKIFIQATGVILCLWVFLPMSARALTVSPVAFNFELNPGDTVIDVIKLYNEGVEPITVYPAAKNFTFGAGENGVPQFYDAGEDPYGSALAPWISIEPRAIVLSPGQRSTLPFTINVPPTPQPGGHYGAILLSSAPSQPSGQAVSVISQVGALILANVAGEIKEEGRIAEFGFVEPKRWYSHLPVDFFLRFENDGNTHLRPYGALLIKNIFNRTVAAVDVNETGRSVLPSSIRRFNFGWKKNAVRETASEFEKEWFNFAFGRYDAALVLNYGNDNKVVVETRRFYVLPWQLMTISAAALILAALFSVRLIGRYNMWVIKRYVRMKR